MGKGSWGEKTALISSSNLLFQQKDKWTSSLQPCLSSAWHKGKAGKQMDRHTDTDRQTDGQADRQTDWQAGRQKHTGHDSNRLCTLQASTDGH